MIFGGKIKTLFIAIILIAVTFLGWSMRYVLQPNQQVKLKTKTIQIIDTIDNPIVYDTTMIKKINKVCRSFNVQDGPVTYSGVFNMVNGADTSKSIRNLQFTYIRKGNDCYYRSGKTETINQGGLYVYIEHTQKRVILSSQKEVPAMPLTDMGKLTNNLQSEHYQVLDQKSGEQETIILRNEHHISCKEYTMRFDTLSGHITNLHARLTCFEDPLNRKKERVLNMSINRFERSADLTSYHSDKIVRKDVDGWQLKAPYGDYKLIVIP